MLFNSLSFILLFLPVCYVAYRGAVAFNIHVAIFTLAAFSLLFYGWRDPTFLIILAGSILYNYGCSLVLARSQIAGHLRKSILFIGIAGNLTLLFYFKYLCASLDWLGSIGIHIAHSSSIILPLGISFFTFTQIGYLVDCEAGIAKPGRFLNYLLFVTFFPHLIAGPILHHREMMPQFSNPETYRFKSEDIAVGLTLFVIGLLKKTIIADNLALIANPVFVNPRDYFGPMAWTGAVAYSLQLYFDFAGYSEMALGLARLFGIRFPANFNSPFKAKSIIEFWQRFHMTLTRYVTLYLYNPLTLWITRTRIKYGGDVSRQATATLPGFLSMIAVPTVFTMIFAGVWHGAGLQFLIYGLLHGFYISVNHAWRIWGPAESKAPNLFVKSATVAWKVTLTTIAVVVAQVFFRSDSVAKAIDLLRSMFHRHGHFHDWIHPAQPYSCCNVLAGLLFVWTMPNILQIMGNYQPSLSAIKPMPWKIFLWRPNLLWGVIMGGLAAWELLAVTETSEFLYFHF